MARLLNTPGLFVHAKWPGAKGRIIFGHLCPQQLLCAIVEALTANSSGAWNRAVTITLQSHIIKPDWKELEISKDFEISLGVI